MKVQAHEALGHTGSGWKLKLRHPISAVYRLAGR